MKYIRKGNDISVKWSLYSDAGELSLEGRSIRLFLKNAYGRKELEDYTISGNAILWTFYGKDQKSTGKHSLELIINEGLEGMITTDACDFVELVSCSKPSASEDDPNIETQSIELRSQLDYSTGEGSAIVVDDMLSETSINPVQNRVITAELQKKIEAEALETRINQEHIYFLYKQNENCVYYKGIDTFEFQELLPWTLNVAVGKPLTPHFIIQDDENQRILSSNKFEITGSPLGLQWQYNDLLYTLIYDNGQSITTSPIPSGSSAMPDWDAQEGEAGFIKNRTHYVNGFLITAAGNYGSASRNIIYKGNTYTLPEDGTKLQLEMGPPVYVYYQRESSQIYVESVSPDYLERYPIKVVEEIIPLADLYIPDTIARKSELTELSAEVSGLSEKIENLPSGESSVFEAIYGETTYDEIVEARNAGKMVICVYNQLIYILIRLTDERANFSVTEGNFLYQVICPKGGSWLRDNVNLSHKLEVLADNKVKVTIGGNSSEVATPQYVENAIQQSGGGGASSDKQGVIRQTQTWTEAADNGYDYVMQDIVRGSIPSYFIDLWKSRGGNTATFNEATGYFEYEYLKDISYEEALFAYSIAVPTLVSYQFANFDKGRFTLPQVSNGGSNGQIGLNTTFTRCSLFECISLKDLDTNESIIVSMSTTFYNCEKLKEIVGVITVKNITTLGDAIFNNCYSLEEVRLKQIKASIGFAASARLSKESVLYMIQNAQASPDITIKLHLDVYDRLEGDAEILAALEAHPNVSLASA